MEAAEKKKYTQGEYLEIERKALDKSEYYQGDVFAMSGASWNHNIISGNFLAVLHQQLKGKSCRPFSSDLRIHIPLSTLYTYPDLVVVCGTPEFLDNEFDTLLNPTFIAEVLSASTMDYDRGKKFQFYRSIPTLKEYWTISSLEYHLEKYVKNNDNTWTFSETINPIDQLLIATLQVTVPLAELYEGVKFQ